MNTPEQIHEPQKFWPTCKTHCLSKSGRAKCARQARNTMRNLFALPASGWLLAALIFFVGGVIALSILEVLDARNKTIANCTRASLIGTVGCGLVCWWRICKDGKQYRWRKMIARLERFEIGFFWQWACMFFYLGASPDHHIFQPEAGAGWNLLSNWKCLDGQHLRGSSRIYIVSTVARLSARQVSFASVDNVCSAVRLFLCGMDGVDGVVSKLRVRNV